MYKKYKIKKIRNYLDGLILRKNNFSTLMLKSTITTLEI
jgi:hypothetical protein